MLLLKSGFWVSFETGKEQNITQHASRQNEELLPAVLACAVSVAVQSSCSTPEVTHLIQKPQPCSAQRFCTVDKASVPSRSQSPLTPFASLPLAFHVGSSSVSIQHGVVGGFLDCFAVELDGLSPQLASEGLVGLLLDSLQIWR